MAKLEQIRPTSRSVQLDQHLSSSNIYPFLTIVDEWEDKEGHYRVLFGDDDMVYTFSVSESGIHQTTQTFEDYIRIKEQVEEDTRDE